MVPVNPTCAVPSSFTRTHIDRARYAAHQAISMFRSDGGTAMGTWLTLAGRLFDSIPMLAQKHAILLTDGNNEWYDYLGITFQWGGSGANHYTGIPGSNQYPTSPTNWRNQFQTPDATELGDGTVPGAQARHRPEFVLPGRVGGSGRSSVGRRA